MEPRILLVADDALYLEVARRALERAGVAVVAVDNPWAALCAAPSADGVVVCLQSPHLDGAAFAAIMAEAAEGTCASPTRVLPGPVDPEGLVHVVRDVLAERRPVLARGA